jgi:hypothetical protein
MKDRKYKQQTRHLGIPVVGDNDHIWPELELKKYQIIENLLLACMKGTQSCIFDEGDLALEKNQDGTFRAILRPSGIHPVLEGIVGGAYFFTRDVMIWDGLVPGKSYHLYITRTIHTFSDEKSVRTATQEYEKPSKLSVLVGVVNLKSEKPSLDRDPKGKTHVVDLERHSSETENPHSEKLVQDELLIRKKLYLGDGQDVDIVIRSGNEQITVPVACLVPSVVGFVAAGKDGRVVTSLARVAFVQVSRVSGAEGKRLGEVSVGYFKQDPKVPNEHSFVVYNEGDADIPMKALVYHG